MKKFSPTPLPVHEIPPFCPNGKCPWHKTEICALQGKFTKSGKRKVTRYPYVTKLFVCKKCGKKFSDSIFSLFYRDRTEPTYEEIFRAHRKGNSRRDIAEDLGCSLDTVQRRLQEMARQGLLIQAQKMEGVKIHESVAYDGVENFAFSQFDPNNINHVVGRESLFLYDFNFTPLNRKGRTTPKQKLKKKLLENRYGPYPKDGIRASTRRILLRMLERSPGDLLFHSDNHYEYRNAIASIPEKKRLVHLITPAKVTRNAKNKLFAINHLDLLTRQKLGTFKRETISFAKHSIAMVESFSLFMIWKNFMRPIFVKKHRRDPFFHIHSPAWRMGIEKKILTFVDFFKIRLQKTHVPLSDDWERFVDRVDPTSRRKIAIY